MSDTAGTDRLTPTPAVFAHKQHLLSACRLLPLTAELAEAAASQLVNLDPWLTLGYRPKSLTQYLQRSDNSLHRFLILKSEQAAGIVCCRNPWLFGPFLELLAVYPQFQSQGLGCEILIWLENQTTAANLWTTVSAFNLRGLNFYRKYGFAKVAVLADLVRTGFDEFLLRKTIRPKNP
jgi:ribosomal protein S18 acetylase RimI-like enzyme